MDALVGGPFVMTARFEKVFKNWCSPTAQISMKTTSSTCQAGYSALNLYPSPPEA